MHLSRALPRDTESRKTRRDWISTAILFRPLRALGVFKLDNGLLRDVRRGLRCCVIPWTAPVLVALTGAAEAAAVATVS